MVQHKTSSRFMAMLLSLILVIGMLPTTAFATNGDVAYIGNTGYATLQEAVSRAELGDTIFLTADDNTAQQIEISKDLNIELDGHSLPSTVFKITAGTVTIGDCKGTGIINENNASGFNTNENSRCYSSIYITDTANVTLNNLRVEQCGLADLEKAVFLGGSASLTINGGSYTGPKDAGVDAIFYYNNDTSSSLTINDGHFEANCGLSVNKTPGTGSGTLAIRKATFVGNGTAFWIEQENGGVTTQAEAERFLSDSSGSYIVGDFDKANIVIGSGLFVSDGFTGPEYGSTDPDNPAQLTPEDGASVTFLPQVLGGNGSSYTYTWYKDSQVIYGATGSSYTIENYQSSEDDGIYSVTVSQGDDSVLLYWKIGDAASIPQLPGDGTEQDPYEISTPEQLLAFAELVNGGRNAVYAKVTNDIDMSGQNWAGISSNNSYTGVFDGQGYIISNLTGTEGLFVNNGGTVKNVRLDNVVIKREGGNLGAIAGMNTGTVFNCVSSGSIEGTGSSAWSIGGLIGHNKGGTLSGSASSCTVTGGTAGGLVGSNHNSGENYGKIIACIYTGTAGKNLEGDRHYGDSRNVYYKDSNGQWKSYLGNLETNENTVLQSVNDYIADNGGAFILRGDGTTYPIGAVSYLDYTEDGFVTKYLETYTEINSENLPTEWKDEWYVVDGDVTIDSRVTVTGDVKLILKDSAKLTVNGGIDVSVTSNSFTIYAQSADESTMGKLTAIGEENYAGIGGGKEDPCGTIVINGGTVTANGGSYAMGLGGNADGDGGAIVIHGGKVTAKGGDGYSYNWMNIAGGAGISVGKSGTVTITNGNVSATGGNGTKHIFTASGGVGIKTGTGGETRITGGYVDAQPGSWESIGIAGTFSTGSDGNGVIVTQNFEDMSNSQDWKGIFFIENAVGVLDKGSIYGETVTPTCGFSVPSGVTLTIGETQSLVISQGVSVKNDGTIVSSGTIDNQGAIGNGGNIQIQSGGSYNGSQPNGKVVDYQIDWDTDGDGTMDDTTYVAAETMPTHEAGSKEADPQYTYTFTDWSPELAVATEPAQYTAQFSQSLNHYKVTLPVGEGYTVATNNSTDDVTYETEISFTVTVKDGYSKTDEFAVKANGEKLSAEADGSYKVTVKSDTNIAVEGIEDITAPADITVSYGTDNFKEFLNTVTFGLFFKDTVNVTVAATDEGSGVKDFTYQLGDGELQTVASENGKITFNVEPEFKGNIKKVTATDNAGNTSEGIDYEYFAVEKAAPTVVTVDTNGYESGKWTNGVVTITVYGSTATSGIAKYQYSTDGGQSWNDMTATEKTDATETEPLNVTEAQLTVSDSGSKEYLFRAVSNAGDESALSKAVTVKIDNKAPEGDIAIEQSSVKEFINSITFGLFFNKSVDVTITGTDDLSGIARIEYYRSGEILTEEQVNATSDWTQYTTISETAEDAEKFVYYVKITDNAGNVTLFGSDGVIFDLTAPVISGVTAGATYYTTQSVTVSDANLESITLNGESVGEAFGLAGNKEAVYTIAATDKAGNGTTCEVTMKPIEDLTETIEGITTSNVTSDNKEDIEAVKNAATAVDDKDASEDEKKALQEILDKCDSLIGKIEETAEKISNLKKDVAGYSENEVTSSDKDTITQLQQDIQDLILSGNLTDAEKEAVQEMADNCEALLEEITAAGNAGTTENTNKVEDITSDNVKPENKEDLTAAKEDLEYALENFGDNYTEKERAEINKKLDQINNALESIEKVETVQDAITTLPDTAEPDDTDTEALVNAVKEQYDQLTEHEKSFIPDELKEKLKNLLGDLLDYRIIQGNGSKWTVGEDRSITMTVNGPVEKFTGIEVDGKAVDAVNYTVKSGSTIISLKAEYLNTLSVGKHTLTVIYTDGEISGEFEILKNAGTVTSETGDNSNIAFGIALMFIAVCGLSGTVFYGQKKKYSK